MVTSERMRIRYFRNSRPRLVRRAIGVAAGANDSRAPIASGFSNSTSGRFTESPSQRRASSPPLTRTHRWMVADPLLNHRVCAQTHRLRDRDANLSCRFEVHIQSYPTEGFDRQVLGFGSSENPLHVFCRQATHFVVTHAIAHQGSLCNKTVLVEHRR